MSKQKLSGTFVPMYHKTIASPEWRSLPHGARSLFLLMKRRYNPTHQGPVFLSARFAAKELGASKNTVKSWLAALSAGGFIVRTRRGALGLNGKGKAAEFRLTDEPFLQKPASPEFQNLSQKLTHPGSKTDPQVGQKLTHCREKPSKQGGSKIGTHLEEDSFHLKRGQGRDPPHPRQAPTGTVRTHPRRGRAPVTFHRTNQGGGRHDESE
jgi:hypothetical protein